MHYNRFNEKLDNFESIYAEMHKMDMHYKACIIIL